MDRDGLCSNPTRPRHHHDPLGGQDHARNGVVVASFSECRGLTDENGLDYRTEDPDVVGAKGSGRRKAPMVVLKQGVTDNRALWEWSGL